MNHSYRRLVGFSQRLKDSSKLCHINQNVVKVKRSFTLWHLYILIISTSLLMNVDYEHILHFRAISLFPPPQKKESNLVGKWLINVPFVEILHHVQRSSKSNLETPDINMLCGVKRCHTANHTAYKCVCQVINSVAKLLPNWKWNTDGFSHSSLLRLPYENRIVNIQCLCSDDSFIV